MTRLIAVPLVLAVTFSTAPGAPRLKARVKIDSPIVGKWREVSQNGTPTTEPKFETYLSDGTRVISDLPASAEAIAGTYTIDAGANPAHIDFVFEPSDPSHYSWRLRGIFKVEGDTLTKCICLTADGTRPKDFTREGSENGIWVYERVKGKN